jgi:hypothetical protein
MPTVEGQPIDAIISEEAIFAEPPTRKICAQFVKHRDFTKLVILLFDEVDVEIKVLTISSGTPAFKSPIKSRKVAFD